MRVSVLFKLARDKEVAPDIYLYGGREESMEHAMKVTLMRAAIDSSPPGGWSRLAWSHQPVSISRSGHARANAGARGLSRLSNGRAEVACLLITAA